MFQTVDLTLIIFQPQEHVSVKRDFTWSSVNAEFADKVKLTIPQWNAALDHLSFARPTKSSTNSQTLVIVLLVFTELMEFANNVSMVNTLMKL